MALAPAVVLVALYSARVARTEELTYGFLLWNLALAAVPPALALVAERLSRSGARIAATLTLTTWLGFLPNAPYLVTDLVHLRARAGVPLWYDIALLGSAALAGLAMGAVSLSRVHALVERTRWGSAGGHTCVAVASLASGFGIYLGRFARLNSWDLVLHPWAVARDALPPLVHPVDHPRAWGVTLVFGALTAASYLVTRALQPDRVVLAGSRPATDERYEATEETP